MTEKKTLRPLQSSVGFETKTQMSQTLTWLLILLLIYLVWRYYERSRSFVVCNGFWQYGYITNPTQGCSGSCKEASKQNMTKFVQFYHTALAVGLVDPNYKADGTMGDQEALKIHDDPDTMFAICPIYRTAAAEYFAWRFVYPEPINYWFKDPPLDPSQDNQNVMLYNTGSDCILVPIIGAFLQGDPGGWVEDSNNWPPRWLAHTFVKGTAVKVDYQTVYPFSWSMPNSMIPNYSSAPEGNDPKNGDEVLGVPTLCLQLYLPAQKGSTSSDHGQWWTYYAISGSGNDGNTSLLGGPLNLSLSWPGTSPQSVGRFWFNAYWQKDLPPNDLASIRRMSGGASSDGGCHTPNGSANGGKCGCTKGAVGWNCLYPRPALPDFSDIH